jgi:hypothetical protein
MKKYNLVVGDNFMEAKTFNNVDELAISLQDGEIKLDISYEKKTGRLDIALFKDGVGEPVKSFEISLLPEVKELFELPEVQALFQQ